MDNNYRWVGGPEWEFAGDGSGHVAGGLLHAAIPDHLSADFGPTCVVIWREDPDRSDSVYFGALADRVRAYYLARISGRRARRMGRTG